MKFLDNRLVKKLYVLLSLVLVMTFFPTQSANAIFGLGKCDKVKKQILKYEKEEKPLVDGWNYHSGKYYFEYSNYMQRELQKYWITLVNLEVKMYSLEKNNPKCFTNTQNDYINDVYPNWKSHQSRNKFYPNNNNGVDADNRYTKIAWDSIYNQ
jgi:hypothetical protein